MFQVDNVSGFQFWKQRFVSHTNLYRWRTWTFCLMISMAWWRARGHCRRIAVNLDILRWTCSTFCVPKNSCDHCTVFGNRITVSLKSYSKCSVRVTIHMCYFWDPSKLFVLYYTLPNKIFKRVDRSHMVVGRFVSLCKKSMWMKLLPQGFWQITVKFHTHGPHLGHADISTVFLLGSLVNIQKSYVPIDIPDPDVCFSYKKSMQGYKSSLVITQVSFSQTDHSQQTVK